MSSPSRKRQRLSSPTYEDSYGLPDDEELEELYRIEISLSQQERLENVPSFPNGVSPPISQLHGLDYRVKRLQPAPITTPDPPTAYNSMLQIQNLASQSTSDPDDSFDLGLPSASPEFPLDRDPSNWFAPSPTPAVGFQLASRSLFETASNDADTTADDSVCLGFTTSKSLTNGAFTGFSNANNLKGSVLAPSKEALDRAARKMKDWSEEDDLLESETNVKLDDELSKSPSKSGPSKGFSRPVLSTVSNTPKPFQTPKPTNGVKRSFSTALLSRSVGSPSGNARPFKSPLLSNTTPRKVLYPKGNGTTEPGVSSPVGRVSTPIRVVSESTLPLRTPIKSGTSSAFSTPNRAAKPAFKTPFKQGMKPGEPGRLALEQRQKEQKSIVYPPGQLKKNPRPVEKKLKKTCTQKIPLRDSGLHPQRYTNNDFKEMNINIAELNQITPQTAMDYSFDINEDSASESVSEPGLKKFGPAEAYDYLIKTKRKTTTQWVNNHWGLILWKLAGLVALDPQRDGKKIESVDDPENNIYPRWHWRTVVQQLEYRYDREYEGQRPAFRLITTGDAPAGSPLVLVVVRVLNEGDPKQGTNAVIEVSDGWYHLQAVLDTPLSRAVARGKIRPGRKLAISGAKLENLKKDPCDIFDAYDSCLLKISGNNSHLAAWHTKLGYQSEPFVATLGSLTHDGGSVPLMDLIVEKVYPVAYIEYIEQPGSSLKLKEGPRSEAEEAEVDYAWRKRREGEASKIQEIYETRWNRYHTLADRVEGMITSNYVPQDDDTVPLGLQEAIESIDENSDAEANVLILANTNIKKQWVVKHLRARIRRERESATDNIDLELDDICPVREVRDFRIVQFRDARTARKPANRAAQITIWDVLSLSVSEGEEAGNIEMGQRFMITNLIPAQKSAWMGNAKDDMIYLSTRQNSRFIRLK